MDMEIGKPFLPAPRANDGYLFRGCFDRSRGKSVAAALRVSALEKEE
jgi:hypothetical protein